MSSCILFRDMGSLSGGHGRVSLPFDTRVLLRIRIAPTAVHYSGMATVACLLETIVSCTSGE